MLHGCRNQQINKDNTVKGKPKRTNTTEKGKAMRKAEATLSFDE